jgi:hypothetical protein
MAVLIIAVALILLLLTSSLYGYDSRDTISSEEMNHARHGVTWANRDLQDAQLAEEFAQARARIREGRTSRRRLAA